MGNCGGLCRMCFVKGFSDGIFDGLSYPWQNICSDINHL
jgi:hypothetical protein